MSVQVIQLSERLEEAEGGAESQVNIYFFIICRRDRKKIALDC